MHSCYSNNVADAEDTVIPKLKNVGARPEPKINVLPDTKKIMSILVSAIAEYCSYESTTEEILLPDTFALEVL